MPLYYKQRVRLLKLKYIILYAAYGLAAFFIFLILLFPKDRAATILSEQINAGFKDGEVAIKEVVPAFPPGFTAVNSTIFFNASSNQVNIESISIYPKILSLYKDVKQLDLKAQAYHGNIDGTVKWGILPVENSKADILKSKSPEKNYRKQYDIDFDIKFENLNIKDLKLYVENFDIISSFIIGGTINYRTYSEVLKYIHEEKIDNIIVDNNKEIPSTNYISDREGSGSGKIELSECNLKSDNIFLKKMGIAEVNFTNIDIEWEKDQDRLSITNFDAKGTDMKIRLKGDVALKIPQEMSTLNLKGELQPYSANFTSSITKLTVGLASLTKFFTGSSKTTIPFKITGTFQKPIFTPN